MADWPAIRTALDEVGLRRDDVVLPGDTGLPAEGALVVERDAASGWTIATVDYGQRRVLRTAPDEEAADVALLEYALAALPAPKWVKPADREAMLGIAAPHLLDLANRAQEGLLIDVPPGILLNRIGALDGIHLYPAETSFEARSLPPTALQSPVHEFITGAALRMRVLVTAPWFGRPGGGLRFTIEDTALGIRDLVRTGELIPVVPLTGLLSVRLALDL